MKDLSLVGKGYQIDEKVVGFYNIGDRVKFWGSRGAFWGLFFGGLFLTIPLFGHVVVLGYLATVLFSGIETTRCWRAVSPGIPKDSVLQYETDVKADSFLVMARGTPEEITQAKDILRSTNPTRLDVH